MMTVIQLSVSMFLNPCNAVPIQSPLEATSLWNSTLLMNGGTYTLLTNTCLAFSFFVSEWNVFFFTRARPLYCLGDIHEAHIHICLLDFVRSALSLSLVLTGWCSVLSASPHEFIVYSWMLAPIMALNVWWSGHYFFFAPCWLLYTLFPKLLCYVCSSWGNLYEKSVRLCTGTDDVVWFRDDSAWTG